MSHDFRTLYEAIQDYQGPSLAADVLAPAADVGRPAFAALDRFRSFAPIATDDDQGAMWTLYALGRVNDSLLASFQSEGRATYDGPPLAADDYLRFFTAGGLEVVEPARFSPFDCEIVSVEQAADDDESITLRGLVWPGLMLGDMAFSRAGVAVTGGRNNIVKEVAETSAIYFTHRRIHRTAIDLSIGWGSNSRWRTDPRRDYRTAGRVVYNADGKTLLGPPAGEDRDGLTAAERAELCRHRCFVTCPKPDGDLWPYDDRLEEEG